jgi:hypothetical protein
MSANPQFSTGSDNVVPLVVPDTPDATSRRTLPARHFKYRRMYKRKADADAAWWIELRRHGQRKPMSMGSASVEHAELEAKLRIDLWLQNREADLRRSMVQPGDRKFSTIAEVFAVVPELPITANPATRASYMWGCPRTPRWTGNRLGC